MARFSAYETTNPTMPLLAPGSGVTLGPFYSAVEGPNIVATGEVFTTVSGNAFFEQTFDATPYGTGTNWDISQLIPTQSGVNTIGPIQLLAPVSRLRYVNGSNSQTGSFRTYISINSNGAHN